MGYSRGPRLSPRFHPSPDDLLSAIEVNIDDTCCNEVRSGVGVVSMGVLAGTKHSLQAKYLLVAATGVGTYIHHTQCILNLAIFPS